MCRSFGTRDFLQSCWAQTVFVFGVWYNMQRSQSTIPPLNRFRSPDHGSHASCQLLVRFDRPVVVPISPVTSSLLHATLHVPVNAPDKCICREEAHRPRQEPVYSARQQAVAEEEDPGDEALDVELRKVVPRAVQEDPDGTSASDEEGLPPPMVILCKSASKYTQRCS